MKIQEKDIYYGPVLNQIAEYSTFTSINKIDEKEGLYRVNDDKRILIKYSTSRGPEWRFTFREDDLAQCVDYIVLNCGNDTICLLNSSQIRALLDQDSKSAQWVKVEYSGRSGMRVTGAKSPLYGVVPHNSFPQMLFYEHQRTTYYWPPFSRLRFYKKPAEFRFSTEDRMFDLADSLTSQVGRKPVTCYMGVSVMSPDWKFWDEKNLRWIENQIEYLLEFDGYGVKLERHTDPICPQTGKKNRWCEDEFLWKLEIHSEPIEQSTRKGKGTGHTTAA